VIVDVDTATPVTWYIHSDHLNRPIAVTDTAGAPVHEAWLPFGEATGSYALNARFPGQWFQSENGLHYNWHRHYDPTIGRYTQADPLGFVDGPSVYAYALNSPQMYIDPDGRNTIEGLLLRRAAFAGGCALADSPFLPFGDAVGAVIIVYTVGEVAYILYTKGAPQSEKRPKNVPPGTRGIDEVKGKYGLDTDDVHGIKKALGNGARDWTGVTPDGTVGVNDGNGNWDPVAPIGSLLGR